MKYTSDVDVQHNFHDNDWIGIIVNTADPTFSGRCQVKVFGLFDNIDNKYMPWAIPAHSAIFGATGGGSLSVPKVGQFVRVQFNNGDQYAPEYTAIQNVDNDLIQKIKNDYQGTHVLLHDADADLTVIYQPQSGFQIFHKESFFQITPDSLVTLSTPNGDSFIQMDGDTINVSTKNEVHVSAASVAEVVADEVRVIGSQTTKIGTGPYMHGVAGETLISLLSILASSLDAKLPSTPGVNVGIVESVKASILSSNVLISV